MSKEEWFDSVESGNLPKVKKMLSEDGSLLHTRSHDKETAIIKASENGHLSVVKYLLKCGANPNDHDETSAANTPLILASFEGHDKVVRCLLRKDADINKQNSAGATPLIAAAGEGRSKVVNLLVQKGADTSRTNADGESACDIVNTLFARNKTLKTKLCDLIEKKERDSLSVSSSSVGGKKTRRKLQRYWKEIT